MSEFKDANGTTWAFDIKFKHVEEIKRFCKAADGKPFDLLAILEKGQLDQIDTEMMVNIVFVLCYSQVRKQFDLAAYDAEMQDSYEMFPELKAENAMVKASRWFGGLMNGQALIALGDAFQEALLDFFPNESRKTALKKLMEKGKELEQIQSETMIQQIDEAAKDAETTIRTETKQRMRTAVSDALSGNVPVSSESILPRTASGS
jgi:hypothetical protein